VKGKSKIVEDRSFYGTLTEAGRRRKGGSMLPFGFLQPAKMPKCHPKVVDGLTLTVAVSN